jgi:tRNA (adenine22-N1)-methyltransferase
MKKRLDTIISLISIQDHVIDVGTDHAYIPIKLANIYPQNKVIASDINKLCVSKAQENIKKNNLCQKIKVYQTDGLQNIKDYYNTIIISGMGTKTIIHILDNSQMADKIILQSNNNLYELRKYMVEKGFYCENEVVIYENNFYYPIMVFKKGKKRTNYQELLFGTSHNKNYYQFLKKKYEEIVHQIPWNKRLSFYWKLGILNHLLKEDR